MAGRRAAGPHGYRRRTAGTWYAANTGHGQGRPVVEHAPGGKRPVTERRGPARQARFQGRRIRRSVRVGETAPGWLRPCITAVILRAMSRWRGRLPGRLPRRSAARCWWSRSDAQTEAALPYMPVSARWVPRRNAVPGAQLKACARNRPPGVPGRRSWGRPVSRQVEQPIAQRPGAMCCDRRNGLAKPQLPRMLAPSCRTEAGQNEVAIGGDVDVAGMRVGVDDTDPEDLRQDPVQATAHRGRSCRFSK